MANETVLKDCLTNCAKDCVASFEKNSNIAENPPGIIYGRGIINGAVSATMLLTGCEFDDALAIVKRHILSIDKLYGEFDDRCLPLSWKVAWDSIDE